MNIIWLAASALAFNLSCAGTLSTKTFFKESEAPYSYVYRMDLGKKQWCEGECKALHDFVSVDPTLLTLQSKKVDTPRERQFMTHTIDRETGAESTLVTSGVREGIMILKWAGQCTKQPFTGFPAFETKF